MGKIAASVLLKLLSMVMKDATPLTPPGTLFLNVNNIQPMIPEDQTKI